MFRVYWKSNRNETDSDAKVNVQRIEGGWWFAEEFDDGRRRAFRILGRDVLSDGETLVEVLEPLGDDFMQTPCWRDGTPQPWVLQQLEQDEQGEKNREHHHLPEHRQMACAPLAGVVFGPEPGPGPGSQLQHLPSWVPQLVPSHLQSEIEQLCRQNTSFATPRASVNPVSREKQKQPHPEQREAHSSQTLQQQQPSRQDQQQRSQQKQKQGSSSAPNQQPEAQAPSFVRPKGVQSGSLSQPTFLPETQSLRKTNVHPKGQQQRRQQVRSKVLGQGCLIDLSQS